MTLLGRAVAEAVSDPESTIISGATLTRHNIYLYSIVTAFRTGSAASALSY
jgi:hypothetical protein